MKRPFAFLVSTTAVVLGTLVIVACGDDDAGPSPMASSDASPDRGRLPAPLRPDASCPVVIDTPEALAGTHVPEGSPLSFNSTPPASGPHYPIWADFKEFTTPVPPGYWLHSAEHGAIVLLTKCSGAACEPILDGFRKVRDALPTDPSCDPAARVRVIITPYPDLDVPVAAVAWGWTYKADCLDLPTLTQFARDRYAQGPENVCAAGRTTF